MTQAHRTLFTGTLVQESFLSSGGTDDPHATVDQPFCRDGAGRFTLRGSGLAGALIATARRIEKGEKLPVTITGSHKHPSVWRCFNSHPTNTVEPAARQHVAIDEQTGAAKDQALFNVETLPPGTRWPFLLEVDTSIDPHAAELAREALSHWAAGRCLLGREVARGLGWLRLDGLLEHTLAPDQLDAWPNAGESEDYFGYVRRTFSGTSVPPKTDTLHGWVEYSGTITAGVREDGYGLDSLSIGGHASEELAAAWDGRFLAADGVTDDESKRTFDPDFAVVTLEKCGRRIPYIPGSSLRGPLRHALLRSLNAAGKPTTVVSTLFGTLETPKFPNDPKSRSAKLLIRDAFVTDEDRYPVQLAWLQHHAEDEFTAGAYGSAKFDRVAVFQGRFAWRMVLEDASEVEEKALLEIFKLAAAGGIGIGGGQWRGHGWLKWTLDEVKPPEARNV